MHETQKNGMGCTRLPDGFFNNMKERLKREKQDAIVVVVVVVVVVVGGGGGVVS